VLKVAFKGQAVCPCSAAEAFASRGTSYRNDNLVRFLIDIVLRTSSSLMPQQCARNQQAVKELLNARRSCGCSEMMRDGLGVALLLSAVFTGESMADGPTEIAVLMGVGVR